MIKTNVLLKKALLGSVAIAALVAPSLGFAQSAGNSTELKPIIVQGQQDGGATATGEDTAEDTATGPVKGYVAKVTATGSKTATDLNEIPQSVSVVGREQIDDQSPQKADEALRYVAGVNASTYGTDSDTDWIFIRGFQADQTGIFLDGLSLYQHGFGTFLVDPFFLERIEVIKGPSSALYGGANPGGFVNYVSKRPTGERLRYVETGINNFGNAYLGLDIGDQVGSDGAVSYRVTGKLSGGGWETDYSDDFRGTIAPSLTWKRDEDTSITFLGSYQHIDLTHTSTGFLPYEGTVVDAPGFGRIPHDLFYGEPDFDSYNRNQAMIGYEFEHTFDNDWTVRQNLRYARLSLKEDGLYGSGIDFTDPTKLGRYRFAHDTDVSIFTVDNQLEGTVSTGNVEHNVLLGLDYRYYTIDHVQGSAFPASSLDPRDPVYGSVPSPVATYLDQDLGRHQLGLYAQDQIKFGDGWIVTLNGRYDFVSTDVNDRLTPANSANDDEGEFTWRAALAYEFKNGLTPYASYSTSFNPTTSTDVNGDLLKSETGQQWEAGVKYQPDFMDAMITAAYFDITRQNVVGLDTSFTPARPAAIGEVEARGFELSAQANVTDGLKVIGALTYLDMEVTKAIGGSWDGTPVGNTPIQVPDITASLWLDYSFQNEALEGVSVAAGVRHIGKSWANRENTLEVPAATLFDAAIRYEREKWAVALNVSNLFDKDYVASCQGVSACGYGAGRTFMLKASTSW